MRGLIGFGTNLVLAHADPAWSPPALAALEFFAHADVFMNPTAEQADIVLPVASCFEREALKIGFEISPEAQSLVQLRPAVTSPPGEARSDTDIVFGIAERARARRRFLEREHRRVLPAATQAQRRDAGAVAAAPEGMRVPLTVKPQKYAATGSDGIAAGFATPSRKVELLVGDVSGSRPFGPARLSGTELGPTAKPALLAKYPLVLTCAKPTLFCQTQHRTLPSLRRKALHPEIELHPQTAAARGIANGSWIALETAAGGMRAKARFNDKLDPRVVIGEHGWWQGCPDLGEPGYDPFSDTGANFNLTVDVTRRDPIGGTPAQRGNVCEVELESAS